MIVTILLSLWASPIFIIETIGVLLLWAFRKITPIKIYTNPKLPYAWGWMFYINPKTFVNKESWKGWSRGNIIVIQEGALASRPAIPLHELRHVWQVMIFGIFQPILYTLIKWFYSFKYGKKLGYFLNPFEQDAYRFSGESDLLEQRIKSLSSIPSSK